MAHTPIPELPEAEGLYELLITERVAQRLRALEGAGRRVVLEGATEAEWIQEVVRHIGGLVRAALADWRSDWGDRLGFINGLIDQLTERAVRGRERGEAAERVRGEGLLRAVGAGGDWDRPQTGLVESFLFTGGNGSVGLAAELRRELRSADGVDLLVSFIRWSGLQELRAELEGLALRKGPIRVLTTTYMGATEAQALRWLQEDLGAEVRVSYDTQCERLHAKAYLFHRNSGFHTAYIGSSNFSKSALTSGLEWNVKVSAVDSGHILETFRRTFGSYWESREFEPFVARRDGERLRRALVGAKWGEGSGPGQGELGAFATYFDLRPFPFQEEILEALTVERRVHGCRRNLVVAATGTGKTMVAAFDFKRLRQEEQCQKLLFVCHRKEILVQAQQTFCAVLKDANWGELWVDGLAPQHFEAVFASIQTLTNALPQVDLAPDHFDVVIIDEAHHVSAESYRILFERFEPKYFLGLTATPERMDGGDIVQDFEGRIAAEIRLPEALNRGLLCPFHYFGLSDAVDLSHMRWERGGYPKEELSKLLTGHTGRVRNVLENLRKYTRDPHQVRALGFCVTVAHAEFMAASFREAGLRAEALTGATAPGDRVRFREALRKGDLAYLFVVDVFNEGVDLPEVDTVLFLRPTESSAVFLQQLGRGLRLSEGKEALTVLDFVAASREEYDFEHKFRAMLGRTGRSIREELKDDFPNPPLGCSIQLERKAREHILDNLEKAGRWNRRALLRRLQSFPQRSNLPLTLRNFLDFEHLPIERLYRKDTTFTGLVAEALGRSASPGSVPSHATAAITDAVADAVADALHTDWMVLQDPAQMDFIAQWARRRFQGDPPTTDPLAPTRALMFYWDLFQHRKPDTPPQNLAEALSPFAAVPALCDEIADFFAHRADQLRIATHPLPDIPLQVHGVYTRGQILSALQFNSLQRFRPSREGVAHHPHHRIEALFVELNKDPRHFSPTTLYQDYAISDQLFHWQSQNRVSPTSPTGQRYIHHAERGERILLFLREQKTDLYNRRQGYLFAGFAEYVRHEGSHPMSIVWQLSHPLPGWIWHSAAKLRVG